MKKLLVALGLIATMGLAQAQSIVQIYGTLDVDITTTNHALSVNPNIPGNMTPYPQNASAVNRVTGMGSSGLSGSNWGLRGSEDLGGGIKAVFDLESALNVPTGNNPNTRLGASQTSASGPLTSGDSAINGQMFDRAAYLGFDSNTLGTLTFGRQANFGVATMVGYDPMGAGLAFSPLGWVGGYAGGGDTVQSRWDNAIKYVYTNNNFKLGAMYSLGGTSNSFTTGQSFGLTASYNKDAYGVEATYLNSKDATKAANENGTTIPFGQIGLTVADTTAYILGARYTVDKFTTKVGYERIQLNNPSNPAYDATIATSYGVPVATVNTTAYGTPVTQNMMWIGETYQLRPNISATVAYYRLTTSPYASTAGVVTGNGQSNYVSGMVDYRFSKRTDVYAGLFNSSLSGPANAAYLNKDVLSFTTGMRHIF
jgi:predicted porin